MAGYDDTDIIGRVKARQAADPAISRRAAILAEVGDGSLRRIEMKMTAASNPDDGRSLSSGVRDLAREFMGQALATHGYAMTEGRVTSYSADTVWIETSDGRDLRLEYPGIGSVRKGSRVAVHHVGSRAILLENHDTGRRHGNMLAAMSMRSLWAWMGAMAVSFVWLVSALFLGNWTWPLLVLVFLGLRGVATTFRLSGFWYGLKRLDRTEPPEIRA